MVSASIERSFELDRPVHLKWIELVKDIVTERSLVNQLHRVGPLLLEILVDLIYCQIPLLGHGIVE